MTYAPRADLSGMTLEERVEHARTYQRNYARSEKRKAVRRKYNQSDKGKANNRAQCARWRAANSDKLRCIYRKEDLKKYGLTPESWDALFVEQGRACAACLTDTPTKIGWVVDHCHDTNRVRGILCSKCNTASGMVKDNPATLRALAGYLERSPA